MAKKVPVQDRVWLQKDGTAIRLGDMEDSHIANCIRMLRRKAERHMDNCAAGYSYVGWFGGNPDSMGAYYAEMGADEESEQAARCEHIIEVFMLELRRRYPNEEIDVRPDGKRLSRRSF